MNINAIGEDLDRIASSLDKLLLNCFLPLMLSSTTMVARVFGKGNLGETWSVCPFSLPILYLPKGSYIGNATSTIHVDLLNMAPTSGIGLGANH